MILYGGLTSLRTIALVCRRRIIKASTLDESKHSKDVNKQHTLKSNGIKKS